MEFNQIAKHIEEYQQAGKKLFTTSSFQSHSLVLLHIISRIDRNIPVAFVNTGYHFPETIRFKEETATMMGLKVIDLRPGTPKSMQTEPGGKLLFTTDPDYCCYLNKTQPMESMLQSHDVWISGIRADQSAHRSSMKIEQPAPHGVIRFHPLLDWDAKMIFSYLKEHNLPHHPLESKGYFSIGCEPCTRRIDFGEERDGRWYGLNKTECGLNIDLVYKKP